MDTMYNGNTALEQITAAEQTTHLSQETAHAAPNVSVASYNEDGTGSIVESAYAESTGKNIILFGDNAAQVATQRDPFEQIERFLASVSLPGDQEALFREYVDQLKVTLPVLQEAYGVKTVPTLMASVYEEKNEVVLNWASENVELSLNFMVDVTDSFYAMLLPNDLNGKPVYEWGPINSENCGGVVLMLTGCLLIDWAHSCQNRHDR